jgi:hypothetical protein
VNDTSATVPDTSRDGRPIRRGPYPEITMAGASLVGYLLGIDDRDQRSATPHSSSASPSKAASSPPSSAWGILRGALRRTSIVENNINQSIASRREWRRRRG